MELVKETQSAIHPGPIYQLAMGFAATKSLLAAHQLGFFDALFETPLTAQEVAVKKNYDVRATEMLLNACVSLKLCLKNGDRYANTPLANTYLISHQPNYLGGFLEHFNLHMYPAWQHLEEAVQSGNAQIQKIMAPDSTHFFQAIDQNEADLETFMMTMEEHSLMEGRLLAQQYDFSKHRVLLDVGGGTGAMLVSILKAHPHLQGILFDRSPVCKIAKRCIEKHGMQNRIEVVQGSFFESSIPTSADVILLSGILHNWSRANAIRILSTCSLAAKTHQAPLLISEQVLNEAKTDPLPAVLCSLNMLVMLEGAQEYSFQEYTHMLLETGFSTPLLQTTGGVRQLLVSTPV